MSRPLWIYQRPLSPLQSVNLALNYGPALAVDHLVRPGRCALEMVEELSFEFQLSSSGQRPAGAKQV